MMKIFLLLLISSCSGMKELMVNPSEIVSNRSFSVSTTRINFENAPIGQLKTETVLIKNLTDEDLTLDIANTCVSEMRVRHSGCFNIKPKADCKVIVDFKPRDAGIERCNINIVSTTGDNETLNVAGEGMK